MPHILLRVVARLDVVKPARLRERRVVPVQLAEPSEFQVIGLGRRQVTFQNVLTGGSQGTRRG